MALGSIKLFWVLFNGSVSYSTALGPIQWLSVLFNGSGPLFDGSGCYSLGLGPIQRLQVLWNGFGSTEWLWVQFNDSGFYSISLSSAQFLWVLFNVSKFYSITLRSILCLWSGGSSPTLTPAVAWRNVSLKTFERLLLTSLLTFLAFSTLLLPLLPVFACLSLSPFSL